MNASHPENAPEESQEYGVKEPAKVGTRIKECPGLGELRSDLPDWEDLKATLLRAVDHQVLRKLQSKGRLK